MGRIYRLWKRVIAGDAPGHAHRQLRKRLININNTLVIIIIYYVVLTPLSVILKLCGKRFLRLRSSPQTTSYWKQKKKVLHYGRLY